MAREAQVQGGLAINVRDSATGLVLIDYQSRPTIFQADVAGTFGPVASKVVATPSGADLDVSSSGVGGLARFINQSPTIPVCVGSYDPDTDTFCPLFDILPSEFYPWRISRYLGQEMGLTGTSNTGTGVTLRFKGIGGTANVLAEVFPA